MAAATSSGLCATCAQGALICLACGQPIHGGRYVEIDGLAPFCETCYRERPACDVCAAPLTDERWQLADGRVSCARCHATAIYIPEQAAALYDEMKAVVANLLGLKLNIPTGMALVGRDQLEEIIRQQDNSHSAPEIGHVLGLYARRGTRRGIYVQNGLPRLLLLQLAAHEFAHAWQGENCPLLHDPLVHEGFAEWVAYKVMGHFGYARSQERMLARTDIYGQGLKWALDLEASQGAAGVVAACRQAR